MKIAILISYLLISATFSSNSYSYETDQYYAWGKDIADSNASLGLYINNKIKKVIRITNRRRLRTSCNSMTFKIGIGLVPFEIWAKKSSAIIKLPSKEVTNKEFYQLSFFQKVPKSFIIKLGRNIRVGDVVFGTDKLSHSVSFGFVYWLKYRSRYKFYKRRMSKQKAHNKALTKAIKFGITSEKTYLGYWTSGALSYADLEANYQGFKMLYSLCNGPDRRILKVNNKWKLVRPVNFKEYVTPNWDESFNNSYFAKRRWKKIRPVLKAKYCSKTNSPFAKYSQIIKKKGKSFSIKLIEKLIERGKLPNPKKHSLHKICNID